MPALENAEENLANVDAFLALAKAVGNQQFIDEARRLKWQIERQAELVQHDPVGMMPWWNPRITNFPD